MRLIVFTDTLTDVNGVARFVRGIASISHQKGLPVQVVHCGPDAVLTQGSAAHSLPPTVRKHDPLLSMAMPLYPLLRLNIPNVLDSVRVLKEFRADAVHLSTPGPVGCAGWFAAGYLGLPRFATHHTDFPAYLRQLTQSESVGFFTESIMGRFYRVCSKVFTRSPEYAAALCTFGVPPNDVVQLRPGIQLDDFGPHLADDACVRRIGFSSSSGTVDLLDGRPIVLSVGRISIEKNLPFLADAWKLRSHGERGPRLVIVGDGPYLSTMQNELAAEVAAGNVVFTGFRFGNELAALYAAAMVFVFPSRTDTLGQVVMEAQASGTAVIVSTEGGPAGLASNGRGLVLPAERGFEGAWAAAIAQLCENAELREQLTAAARRDVASRDLESSVLSWWMSQEDALSRGSKSSPTVVSDNGST